MFASLPGRLVDSSVDSRENVPAEPGWWYVGHGWPWMFLRRSVDSQTLNNLYDSIRSVKKHDYLAPVRQPFLWKLCSNVRQVYFLGALGDMVAAFAILLVGSALFEAWRRRRRRLFQFYLVELLALVTLAAVLLSWLAVEIREREEERRALCEMTRTNDAEHYSAVHYELSLAGPHWIRQLVGDWPFSIFDRAIGFSVAGPPDSGFGVIKYLNHAATFDRPQELVHLRHLRFVDFDDQYRELIPILRFLPRPDRIESLSFVAIDDDKLLQLQRFTNLRRLSISFRESQRFSDRSVAALGGLAKLEELDLSQGNIDNAWFDHLGRLRELRWLRLAGPRGFTDNLAGRRRFTDAGIRHLSQLRQLRHLDLCSTKLSDAGLEHLSGLASLEEFDIGSTHVTASGLRHLKHLASLKKLSLPSELAGSEALKELQTALPKCEILCY